MASLAFAFAARKSIPETTDHEWFSRYHSWHHQVMWRHWERSSDEDRELDQGIYDSPGLTSNFSDARHTDDPEINRLAGAWIERTYKPWVDGGRKAPPPTNDLRDYEQISGEETRLGLSTLLHYRGTLKKLPKGKIPSGATHAFLANIADPYTYELTGNDDYELRIVWELARTYGGDYLAIWTYGHAVHAWYASAEPGHEPTVTVADFRLFAPCGRSRGSLDALQQAMTRSALHPDFGAARALLGGEAISVRDWFRAFGIDGAEELVPTDHNETWARFEGVARSLLAGKAADAKDVRALNTLIDRIDDEVRLKAKPASRSGQRANAIARAGRVLAEVIGEPDDDVWRGRFKAARTYWDFGEGDAGDLLVTSDTPFGRAAGLGRLLGHYPFEYARDPLFLSWAAIEAEAANGHGFVEPLLVLAETASSAGFTLSVHRGDADASFKRAMKIEGGPDDPGEWAAHAFVDLPKADGRTVLAVLEKWYKSQRADGFVVRANADGSFKVLRFEGGQPREEAPSDPKLLEQAARGLVPRNAVRALGHADLLEPGEWTEGAYDGADQSDGQSARAASFVALRGDAQRFEIRSARDMERHLGSRVRKGFGDVDKFAVVRVCLPCDAADELKRLLSDLVSSAMHARAWAEGSCVVSQSYDHRDVGLLSAIVADLPAGTTVTVAGEPGLIEFHVVA